MERGELITERAKSIFDELNVIVLAVDKHNLIQSMHFSFAFSSLFMNYLMCLTPFLSV